MVPTTNISQKCQKSLRLGIVALALIAALGSILNSYEDAPLLTRQAALQDYQETGSPPCRFSGQSKLPVSNLVIDMPAIRAQPRDKLDVLKQFTTEAYEKYMMDVAGKEHYTLFHWLTKTYQDDCRHVVDIGTRYVASALALGATGVPIKTFDIPTSKERFSAFRGKSEQEWQTQLQNTAGVDIEFHNLNLLEVSDEEFRTFMSTWLIILDTFHKPYSVPFERQLLKRLVNTKPRYEGLMILDDINFSKEMKAWWEEVQEHASEWGFVAHDLTKIGHSSGTALLDFSGKVEIKKE